jgi:hypothetical protein
MVESDPGAEPQDTCSIQLPRLEIRDKSCNV